jgi:Ca2+-binding RTX toxin-like protein
MTTYSFDAYAVYSNRSTRDILGADSTQKTVSLVLEDGNHSFTLEHPVPQVGVFVASIDSDFVLMIDGDAVSSDRASVVLLNANWRATNGLVHNTQFSILTVANYSHPTYGLVTAEFMVHISGAPLPQVNSISAAQNFMNGLVSSPAVFPGLTVGAANSLSDLTSQITENDYIDLSQSDLEPLSGGLGDDTILGGIYGQSIYGGPGNDSIRGGVPPKALYGEAGNDTLTGSFDTDRLYGGDGDDLLQGFSERDRLDGDAGNDTLHGDEGVDSVSGGYGNDSLFGGDGNDEIFDTTSRFVHDGLQIPDGVTDNDTIDAGAGDDAIYISAGADLVSGGTGNDSFWIGPNATTGESTLDGGEGSDQIDLTLLNHGVKLDLTTGAGTLPFILSNIENMTGTLSSDTLFGDDGNNSIIQVGGQNNWIFGRGGDDRLHAEGGQSHLFGGDGNDIAYLQPYELSDLKIIALDDGLGFVWQSNRDAPFINNFVADDVEELLIGLNETPYTYGEVVRLANATEIQIDGTTAGERIEGSWFADRIAAGAGTDWINANGGADTIDGGAGRDMVDFSAILPAPTGSTPGFFLSLDLAAGTAEIDSDPVSLTSIERATGTHYADLMRGTDRADHLRGMGHYDWFIATEGADTLDGGTGRDMVSFTEWTTNAPDLFHDVLNPEGALPDFADISGVVVDLTSPANNTNLAQDVNLRSIERVTGTSYRDVFIGDGNSNEFRGQGGYDYFVGSSGGRERYYGDSGRDTMSYQQSSSGISASLSSGRVVDGKESGYGTRGDAALDLYFEIENLVGTHFDDSLAGSSDRNALSGLGGDDLIFGYGGRDHLRGGAGNDTIDGGSDADYAYFSGQSSAYTVTRTDNRAVTISGADGTDELINVEFFVFDDTTLNLWTLPLA